MKWHILDEKSAVIQRNYNSRDAALLEVPKSLAGKWTIESYIPAVLRLQIVYKGLVYTDGFKCYEDAEECFSRMVAQGLDQKYISIEVEIDRDKKRHDGHKDTRAKIEEMVSLEYKDRVETAEGKLSKVLKIILDDD